MATGTLAGADTMLVVGASGILRPVAATLAERGALVTGVGRTRPFPDGVEGLHVDATDAAALRAALGARSWGVALVYDPAVSPESLSVVRERAAIVVRVRTSAAADPARGEFRLPDRTLQLGWHDDGVAVRWHTPEEISAAALSVLDDDRPRILGSVRPWERRP